jgi:hypothetical protein
VGDTSTILLPRQWVEVDQESIALRSARLLRRKARRADVDLAVLAEGFAAG